MMVLQERHKKDKTSGVVGAATISTPLGKLSKNNCLEEDFVLWQFVYGVKSLECAQHRLCRSTSAEPAVNPCLDKRLPRTLNEI